jgi:hypothetical protein
MMEASNRHKRAATLPSHDGVRSIEACAHHHTRRLEHAAEGWRVSAVQKALTTLGALSNEVHIGRSVEGQQLGNGSISRLEDLNTAIQTAGLELSYEGSASVRPERMTVTEAVASEPLTDDDA